MRQSDNQAWECRKMEQAAASHSSSSSSFSSKLMCRKREQERNPNTQQCMEYCGARRHGQEVGLSHGQGRGTPQGSCPIVGAEVTVTRTHTEWDSCLSLSTGWSGGRGHGRLWRRAFRAVRDTHWDADERQGPRELPGEVGSHGGYIGSLERAG